MKNPICIFPINTIYVVFSIILKTGFVVLGELQTEFRQKTIVLTVP